MQCNFEILLYEVCTMHGIVWYIKVDDDTVIAGKEEQSRKAATNKLNRVIGASCSRAVTYITTCMIIHFTVDVLLFTRNVVLFKVHPPPCVRELTTLNATISRRKFCSTSSPRDATRAGHTTSTRDYYCV